jgi:hypothetical protein
VVEITASVSRRGGRAGTQRAVGAPGTEAFDGFNADARDGVVTDARSGRT